MEFSWLSGLAPSVGVYAIIVVYLIIGVCVLRMPKSAIMRGASDNSGWRDLRYWVVPLVVLNALLYWGFR